MKKRVLVRCHHAYWRRQEWFQVLHV